MLIIKFGILILILLASTFIGILIAKKYCKRVEELKEIKNALNIFKTKIKFTYEPIPEIFNDMSFKLKENIGDIFSFASKSMKNKSAGDAWNEAIDKSNTSMTKEDLSVLRNLGKLLRKNRCRWTT